MWMGVGFKQWVVGPLADIGTGRHPTAAVHVDSTGLASAAGGIGRRQYTNQTLLGPYSRKDVPGYEPVTADTS